LTRTNSNTDQSILPLAITSLVASALAGIAVMVSANTQVPSYIAPQGLSADSAFEQLQNQLHANKLKQNALTVLRALPDYNNTVVIEASYQTPASLQKQLNGVDSASLINVNTFLLSNRISNQSRLAELQMQPFFDTFDADHFVNSSSIESTSSNVQTSASYKGVGFPHIETSSRADKERYKPYKPLVSVSSSANGDVVPHVKCMGLSAQSVAKRAKKYDAKIFELAVKHNVSASLVKAVVAKESCFNPSARSHVGAIGLMQLMPETAQWLKVSKPENVHQNLNAGVRYLAQLRKRFGSNELALAAYNAGPGNVERYNGIPPFAETQNYVQDVMYFYRGYVATTRFVNAMNDFE